MVSESNEGNANPAAVLRQRLFKLAIWLGLIFATLAVYLQVANFEFVDLDDAAYVFENAHIQGGVTMAALKWSMTGVVAANWMPVTLLSHLLDWQLFELHAGMHHLMNLLLHLLATALLYLTLRRATGREGPSALVALIFAIHPLHVESVAWISERKDVLSTVFWFLGLYGYVYYAERPSRVRYFLLVAAPFCLGLMSKPMLVTFPFVLLLMDIWPLRRVKLPWTIWEKLPLFTLSSIAAVVTYLVQSGDGAVQRIPLAMRTGNALVSYVTYLGQTFWPVRLAVFYPYPHDIAWGKAAAAAAALLVLTALALAALRKYPYVTVGWLWYVGMLVPVIGLVQVGKQAHADRYMYVPMVGLLLILVWGAADFAERRPRLKPFLVAAAGVCVLALSLRAWQQTAYWRNSEALFGHALEVTKDNWLAENNLGIYLARVGRQADAFPHFANAVRIDPGYAAAHNNLGAALLQMEGCDAAVPHFLAALRAQPDFAEANTNWAGCLAAAGNDIDAIPRFERALRSEPQYPAALIGLAASLARVPGREQEALERYGEMLRLFPDDPRMHDGLGQLLVRLGRTHEGIKELETAQDIQPEAKRAGELKVLKNAPD